MIRKILMILMALVLMLVPVCAYAEGDGTETAEQEVVEDISESFAVFFTADVNGQLKGDKEHIGYSKLASLLAMQEESANLLVLDAGNALGKDDPDKVVKVMGATNCVAAGIGTRDAALGKDKLRELDAKAGFPLLCANWLRADGELYYQPYAVVEVGQLTIGIIGLISPEIKEMYPEETENDNVYDPAPIANIYYDEMMEAGCDCFIALTSLGFEGEYTPDKLGLNCPWLDMILDSNTAEADILNEGKLVEGTDTAVFNLASDFKAMTVIQVTAGHYGYQGLFPSTMTAADFSDIPRDQGMEEFIDLDFSTFGEENGEGGGSVKTHRSLSNAQKFILLTLLITAIVVAVVVLVGKKKEKK